MPLARERPALPDVGGAAILGLAACFAVLAGALLIWAGPAPGAVRLSMLRHAVTADASAIDATLRSYAALDRLIAAQAAEIGKPGLMVPALAQLVRDDPQIWDLVLLGPTGAVLLETRPAAGMSGSAVALLDRLVPVAGDAPGASQLLVRSSEAAPPPRLIGVVSGGSGAGPLRDLRVVMLMRARDLPLPATADGPGLLIGNDGAIIAESPRNARGGAAPENAAGRETLARISDLWRREHSAAGPAGSLRLAMADGVHRLLFEHLVFCPAAVLVDAGLAAPPLLPWNQIVAVGLLIAAIAAAAIGLRRGRSAMARLAKTAGPSPIESGLAVALAHDFNNVLAVLSADADMIEALHPEDAILRELGRSVQAATQTGAALVGRVLAIGGRLSLAPRLVNLGAELARGDTELTSCLRQGQRLVRQPAGPEVFARVDPQALRTVLSGLLRETAKRAPADAEIHLGVRSTPGIAVVIEIAGLVQPAGPGGGLGVSAAAGFARQSGGSLMLAAGPGATTRFVLTLPGAAASGPGSVVARSLRDLVLPEDRLAPRLAPRLVLVVDDNVPVRQSIARRLRLEGYEVAEAGTVAEAEDRVAEGVDLMVTDIVLGDATDGWSLAVCARAIDPALPLVFMSGFMSARQPDLLAGDEHASFVRKPVDASELRTVIEGLLALRQTRPAPR